MTGVRQLALDGREVERIPRSRALTDRQREILRYVRACSGTRPRDVGLLMHMGRTVPCGACTPEHACEHASSDGVDALRRLAARGLVYRQARGVWRAAIEHEDWVL
jgi:hypothetical protein